MFVILARNWVMMMRGALAIVFGALCFFYPGVTLTVMTIVFGVYALAFRLRRWVARQAVPDAGG